jgi:hypothetical protein
MNKIILIIFLYSNFCHSQINTKPNSYNKIIVEYKSYINLSLDENTVYGDSLLLTGLLPRKNYKMKRTNFNKLVPYIEIKNLTEDERIKLTNFFVSNNILTKITYNVKNKKKVFYNILGFDTQYMNNVTKLLNTSYSKIKCETVIYKTIDDFNYKESSSMGVKTYNFKDSLIIWDDENKLSGTFLDHNHDEKYYSLIFINPDLDRNITPHSLFGNCEYGIEKIITKYHTTELSSVIYK